MRTTLLTLLTLCCASPLLAASGPEEELRVIFDKMASAWNQGDIQGHISPYADSAAMMSRTGPFYGRDRIKSALEQSFWKDGKPLQQLRFEQVVVRVLEGGTSALVTGHFILSGGGKPDASGWFTTVWEKKGKRWQIVMDASA
ncbi:MAG: nuclear transport factor 2 family protein [Gemmatimonadales bacterium]